jgi:hypothetical protein
LRRDVDALSGQKMASLTRLGISNSMGISKKVSWCCPIGARPETAKSKWTFLRGERASVIAGLLTVSAFVVVATFIVAVGVILTSTGWIFAAIRQRSRRKKALSAQHSEGYVDAEVRV